MLLQWLTFAVMLLIQAVGVAIVISAMRTTLATYGDEIKSLREWRHKMAPKEMQIDDQGDQLKDHEARIRVVESRHLAHVELDSCPVTDCPVRKHYTVE